LERALVGARIDVTTCSYRALRRRLTRAQCRTRDFADRGGKAIDVPTALDWCSLRLYIASSTPNSQRAKANLDSALREFAASRSIRVEIIDVLTDAKRVATDSVIVTPTLVVIGPKRRFVMIGDLSDPGKLEGLLKSAASPS
jgi:KaiB domain